MSNGDPSIKALAATVFGADTLKGYRGTLSTRNPHEPFH